MLPPTGWAHAIDAVLWEQHEMLRRIERSNTALKKLQRERANATWAAAAAQGTVLTRALYTQLGQDRFVHFLVQLKWLVWSWVRMRRREPSRLRTDILVRRLDAHRA